MSPHFREGSLATVCPHPAGLSWDVLPTLTWRIPSLGGDLRYPIPGHRPCLLNERGRCRDRDYRHMTTLPFPLCCTWLVRIATPRCSCGLTDYHFHLLSPLLRAPVCILRLALLCAPTLDRKWASLSPPIRGPWANFAQQRCRQGVVPLSHPQGLLTVSTERHHIYIERERDQSESCL